MKKVLLKLPRLLVLSLTLLSCSFANAEEQTGEFVFILKGRGNIFWKVIREGVEETSRNLGIRTVVLHTDDDQTPEAQLNMCTSSLVRKPKIIVLGAATKNVGIECFRKAAAEGVLAADIDGNVTLEDAKEANIRLAFSVGSDNTLIGKKAAEFLVQATSIENPSILVIKGLAGSIVSEKRASGFLEELKRSLPKANVIGSPSANWDRLKAMNTTLDFLQRDPQLSFIFSVSDVMTMGVVEAVRVAGKTGSVKVLSVDGIADARKAVQEQRMLANVAQLPYLMGKRAVELAVQASRGEIRNHNEFTPTPVLTKEILEKHEDSNLQYLR